MWQRIAPLINSGKKLKISPEKLIALAIANSFEGSIVAHGNESTEIFYCNPPEISSDTAPETLAFIVSSALFSLSDKKGRGSDKNSDEQYTFLYRFITGYPDALLESKLAPHKEKMLSFKQKTLSFPFLSSLRNTVEETRRIPVAKLFSGNIRALYFLLITGFAALSEPTDAEKKEISSLLSTGNPTVGSTGSKGRTASAPQTAREKMEAYRQHIKRTTTPEKRIRKYLDHLKHYRSVFDLFDSDPDTPREEIKRKYMEIIKRLHPDQLSELPEDLRKDAEKMLAVVNDMYMLLKDDESYHHLQQYAREQRRIMTKDDYLKEREIDSAAMKAEALYRLKEYNTAYKMFSELYEQTKYPKYLEKMMWSYYRDKTLETKTKGMTNFERRENLNKKYKQLLEMIEKLSFMGPLPIDVMFIEAEMAENLGKLRTCRQILKDILLRDPNDFRAKGWLKKVMFYEARQNAEDKKKKK